MGIPAAEQSLVGHAGHLNASQEEAFEQFKKEVSEQLASDPEPRWYDDTTLLYVRRPGIGLFPDTHSVLSHCSQALPSSKELQHCRRKEAVHGD